MKQDHLFPAPAGAPDIAPLTPEEKVRMREAVTAHMELFSASAAQPAARTARFFPRRLAMAAAAAVFLIASGGMAYAAENSLPGDFLYPVKTGVNERVARAFSATPAAKARLAAAIAERRLAEADALARAGRLDEKTAELLREDFEMNMRVALDGLKGEADAPRRERGTALIEARLEAHAAALSPFAGDATSAAGILSSIDSARGEASSLLGGATSSANAVPETPGSPPAETVGLPPGPDKAGGGADSAEAPSVGNERENLPPVPSPLPLSP